jgi:hypothetical protein
VVKREQLDEVEHLLA